MDIESILSSLGLDLTNPEVKKGAIEAINAILDSRAPAMSMDGITDNMSGEQDVEMDPDLLQPSIKNKPQESSDDIEINDEDDVLKNIKHNDSEDPQESPMSNKSETGDSDDKSSNSDSEDSQESSSNSSGKSDADDTEEADTNSSDSSDIADAEADEDSAEDAESEAAGDDDAEDGDESNSSDDSGESAADAEGAGEEESATGEDSDEAAENDDADGIAGETDDIGDDEISSEDETESDGEDQDDELDIDEDELLDDNLKDTYDDQEEKAKYNSRKVKRERTLAAAKKVLDDARTARKAPALIRELEKAIEALESLEEAVNKNIKDMSDEEFNLMVNRVFDAIDALGDSGLTYTSDEERQIKAKEIKDDIEDKQTQAELSSEDVAKIRAETQAIKAREKEKAKYSRRSRGSFKGFQDFLNSLYRAIALQVHTEETRDDTWSAINRRYSGTGVLQQGKRINELPNKKIPVIDFYFDQSGSWSESDIDVGKKAVEALVDMEEKGQIKINVYYFANHVHTDAQSARNEGGTWAWNEIVKNVIATQATNVIVMTDSDMETQWDMDNYWYGSNNKAASYTVPGYVWYLWRDGDNAPRLPRDLKGRGGTQQFSFNRGDI